MSQIHILSIKPKEYLQQGPSHCGVYSIKAILSSFGLDTKKKPEEYHTNLFGRITGGPSSKTYYENILKEHGLNAITDNVKHMSSKEKIIFLKTKLENNIPIMLRIGNGYIASDRYNHLLGKIIGHWITLWGYDNEKQVFYIYDSGLKRGYWDLSLPIGNTIRSYSEVLRDWNFGKFQFWYWYSGNDPFTYIETLQN